VVHGLAVPFVGADLPAVPQLGEPGAGVAQAGHQVPQARVPGVPGGGGAGAYFFLIKKSDKNQEAKADDVPLTPPKVAFSDMQDILVNIQSNDGTPAYLKLGVSLELEDDAQKTAIQPLMPRITDQFQAYLRELRLDDLKGSAGVLRLKEELLRRVNVAAAPYHVRDVLLKEMIVQ